MNLSELLERHCDNSFIVTDDGDYTYGQIHRSALQFASVLQKQGIAKGDCVAILAGNSAAYVTAWLGTMLCGAIAATLNNQLIADALCYTVRQSACRLIVADRTWMQEGHPHLTEDLKALPVIDFGSETDFFGQLDGIEPANPAPLLPHDAATILYTSGTTGLPKGVVNSHGAYLASGAGAARLLGLRRDDRLMVFLPLFHVNPQMMGFMSAIAVGASIALRPRFSATSFFEDARRFGATGCTYVGPVLAILVNRYPDSQRDHTMRFCFGAGAHGDVWRAVEERFGMAVHEVYGMTEMGGWTTGSPLEERRYGSCGKVREDMELIIVDAFDNEVAAGTRGEIVGRPRRPNRMLQGYWNQPDKFVEALGNFWFHSGDLGSRDEDGYVYYHGRLKELIRRGGEMISPIEMESRLMDCPGVEDCAIVGVADPIMDEEIKAVVVCKGPVSPDGIAAFLKLHFPQYMLPRYYEFVEELPKTANGKVRKQELKQNCPATIDIRPARTGDAPVRRTID